jgi:hypothetical protein
MKRLRLKQFGFCRDVTVVNSRGLLKCSMTLLHPIQTVHAIRICANYDVRHHAQRLTAKCHCTGSTVAYNIIARLGHITLIIFNNAIAAGGYMAFLPLNGCQLGECAPISAQHR